ncbi:hypothetical protein AeMF1_004167 [Aphanomyces euteiches]|nr:hypothetical protein AeMF1_004167 [Aphanomyces euteiches]
MHQRGWGAVDGDHSRDLQRRRQNEYHAALAEQVRMQEAKKKSERDERLRANASAAPTQAVQGGLFAGLGENHVVGTRFARGHHVEKMAADVRRSTKGAAPPPQSQQHLGYNEPPHAVPPPHYPQQDFNPPPQFDHGQYHHPVEPYMQPNRMEPPPFAGYPNEGYMQQPPQQHFQPPGSHHAHFPTNEHSPPLPQPPQHAMNQPSPPPPTSLQPVPGTSHGRRHVRGAAPVDSSRRNAQIEAQAMLKQQMEENQRRKQEAKRQQEMEERLELERIQREVKLQEEALEAEKKAKQKEAMAKQQQLEADLRLKQEDQQRKNPKHRQKLVDDVPPPPAQSTGTSLSPSDHGQGFQDAVHVPWNAMQQMQQTPRDPPPPLWSQPAPTHGVGGDLFHPGGQGYDGQSFPPQQQQIFNQPLAFHHNMYPPAGMPALQQMPSMTHLNPPPMVNGFQSPPPSMAQFAMDERLQMLAAELARQRALVEQLVMQPTVRNGGITVEDFEKLRREMQEELDRRDARHKQELEAWKLRAETLERQSTQGHLNGLSCQPSVNRSFVHGESNQVDQDDVTFPTAAAVGNNDSSPSKSPQKPFPGLYGSYKLQQLELSPSKSSVMEQGEGTFVSNSPQRPFPGVNGTYKFTADLLSKQDNPSRAMATKQSFPEQRSARKMQSKAPRLESNQEGDDNNAFNSTTFSKASASPTRSVKFASASSTSQSSPTTSPAKLQDERGAYASKTSEKPFPGVHGTYNIPSSRGKSPPKAAALKAQSKATASTRKPVVSTSESASSPVKQRRVSPRQRPSPQKSPPRTQPTLAQQRQQRRPVQTSPQEIPKQFAVVNLLNDATTPVAASQTLKCESQMIYFDGKVDPSTPLETEFGADDHLGEITASNLLSPRFNALFSHHAASNDATKGLLTSRTVNLTTEPSPLRQEPIQLGSNLKVIEETRQPTTLPDVPASFRVQEVKPSTAMSFRYDAHASILAATASSPTASFDIDDLYEKNTARCELLEQLEKTKSPAPQHVEELVSTFRRITSRKAARPQDGEEVRTTSNWVGDGLPKWLK